MSHRGHLLFLKPGVQHRKLILPSHTSAKEAQQHIDRINYNLSRPGGLDLSGEHRQQAGDGEFPAQHQVRRDVGLQDDQLARLFQRFEIPAHGCRIFADDVGLLFKGDKNARLTRQSRPVEKLQAQHRFARARPPAQQGRSAGGHAA